MAKKKIPVSNDFTEAENIPLKPKDEIFAGVDLGQGHVKEVADEFFNIVQTIKAYYVDIPVDTARELFPMMALAKRLPEYAQIVVSNFTQRGKITKMKMAELKGYIEVDGGIQLSRQEVLRSMCTHKNANGWVLESNGDRMFTCPICQETFTETDLGQEHVKEVADEFLNITQAIAFYVNAVCELLPMAVAAKRLPGYAQIALSSFDKYEEETKMAKRKETPEIKDARELENKTVKGKKVTIKDTSELKGEPVKKEDHVEEGDMCNGECDTCARNVPEEGDNWAGMYKSFIRDFFDNPYIARPNPEVLDTSELVCEEDIDKARDINKAFRLILKHLAWNNGLIGLHKIYAIGLAKSGQIIMLEVNKYELRFRGTCTVLIPYMSDGELHALPIGWAIYPSPRDIKEKTATRSIPIDVIAAKNNTSKKKKKPSKADVFKTVIDNCNDKHDFGMLISMQVSKFNNGNVKTIKYCPYPTKIIMESLKDKPKAIICSCMESFED